jgi:hypothetical protein
MGAEEVMNGDLIPHRKRGEQREHKEVLSR